MSIRAAVCLLAAFAASPAFSAKPAANDRSIVRWSKPGYKISRAEFSSDGQELLLQLRLYVRHTGTLRAEVELANTKARRYDPLLGVLALADLRFEELVHGREGQFSPDGRAVAFVAQANPATFEQAETTDKLEDNYVAVYDRTNGKTLALTKARWDLHSAPRFTPDGKRVTYLNLVATNGGTYAPRLTEFDLASQQARVLYEPPLVGASPAVVFQFGYLGSRLLATVAMPQSATEYANERVVFIEQLAEIKDGKAIELFNWGKGDTHRGEMERLQFLKDGAMTFDDQWRRISMEGVLGAPIGRKYADDETLGVPSPDSRLLARALTAESEGGGARYYVALVVEEIESGKVVARFPLDRATGLRPESIAWSADSRRLAWPDFATSNWADDHDTISVVTLP